MVFYPDNANRATRLQQLVDSIANMQTDMIHDADEVTEKNTNIVPKLDAVLFTAGVGNANAVIDNARAELLPDERIQFDVMLVAATQNNSDYKWTYFVASVLTVPTGVVLTSTNILSAARFAVRLSVVMNIAKFFKATEDGGAAAKAAAQEVEEEALKALKSIEQAGIASDITEEATAALSVLSRVGVFLRIIGNIGLVVTVIIDIIEAVKGAEQKTRLIDAIHQCQIARLQIANFRKEAAYLLQQLELLTNYLGAMPGGDDPDANIAQRWSKKILTNVGVVQAVDWSSLETALEAQDRLAGNFYGADDLHTAEVIKQAQKTT